MTRIKQNILLCDYYQNKGQFPQKYLHELQRLAAQAMSLTNLEPAPRCQIAPDGSQIILGDWTNNQGVAAAGVGADLRKSGGNNGNSAAVGGQSKLAQNSSI